MLFGSRLATLGFAAIVVALAVAYGTFLVAPAAGIFHDDGVYLVTAKALAEGSGYRIVSLPWEPAQTKYPVLFPFLLSLVWRVFPEFPGNLPLLRLVPLGFGVAWLALSYRLLRALGESRDRTMLGLAVVAVSPWVVFLSTATLAETVFSALIVAATLLLVRIDAGGVRRLEALGAGMLMSAAVLTRAAGAAPALAGFLVLILRRRWRSAAEYAFGAVVVYLPWLLWVASQPPTSPIDPFYEGAIYGSYNVVTDYAWPDKLTVVGLNAIHLSSIGEFWGLAGSSAGIAVGLFGSALILRGLWSARTNPIALIVVAYVGMLLLFVWPPYRYVVPIMPLLVWLAIKGAGARIRIAAGLALMLFVTGSWALANTTLAVHRKGGTWFNARGVDDWSEMRAQYRLDRPRNPERLGDRGCP